MNVHEQKAHASWGVEIPEWIVVLAKEADATSQNKVAKRLKRSAPMISQVLSKTYKAKYDGIEEAVRGALMSQTVQCPGMRIAMTLDVCRDWRELADDFSGHNGLRVMMFRACHRCPTYLERANATK